MLKNTYGAMTTDGRCPIEVTAITKSTNRVVMTSGTELGADSLALRDRPFAPEKGFRALVDIRLMQ
jgi:hypothetical protein